MSDWKAVETAPHETYVLLGWWDDGKWNSATGFASHGWSRNGISTMSRHGQATHWMPLPEPPASKSPYPFCRTPEKCAGKGYCPAEFACND